MNELSLPASISIGDITVRDGLQALEHYVPLKEKLRLAEELILTGYKALELTNLGNPKAMPQFKDAEALLDALLDSERVGPRLAQNGGDVTLTVVAINERAVVRALDYRARRGRGPDYLLQMVSTDPEHHRVNSGVTLEEYWRTTERCIAMAKREGMGMCGTVSTIWGSPMAGSEETRLETAVEFARRYLELGAAYIEHADHDGSADPLRVFEYFRMILDPGRMGALAHPSRHLAHFHTTRGMGLANYLAALQAGVVRFETTLSGIGGQPANVVDGVPVLGTGSYYHRNHLTSGLVGGEDFAAMCEAMGIRTGLELGRLMALGEQFRDSVLRAGRDEIAIWLANVARVTALSSSELAGLAEVERLPDPLWERATEALAKERPLPEARALAEGLLASTQGLLQRKSWAPSRAETLLAGPLRARQR